MDLGLWRTRRVNGLTGDSGIAFGQVVEAASERPAV